MKKVKIILLLILLASIISSFYISYLGTKYNKILYNYINKEVTRTTTNLVSSSVNEVVSTINNDILFEIKKTNDEIYSIDLNTQEVNKILKEINNKVLKKVKDLEKGKVENLKLGRYTAIKNGLLCELPLSLIKNNIIISNIGPTIPIKLSFSGGVKTKTKNKITSYGINNIVIEVNILVEIKEQVTMPISSKETIIEITSPLVLKIVQGQIPRYFETDINTNSLPSTILTN